MTLFSRHIHPPKYPLLLGVALYAAISGTPPAHAEDIDTRLRLNRSIEQQNSATERELLEGEDYLPGKRPQLIIDGKRYTVGHNVNDLGRALYLSIRQKNWSAVLAFLGEYETLPGADPLLLAYARGALARIRGDMEQAEREYRHLLKLNPDFLPGRLELARVLFENHSEREADALFRQIAAQLDPLDNKQDGVRSSVSHFIQALQQRRAWSGSLALGPTWNDNLNQSSESHTCLLEYAGQCLYQRNVPDAIEASGLDYEFTLNRQLPLSGHNGLYLRTLWYGQSYREHADYNESTLVAQAGYRFRDLDDQIRLAPLFEFSRYANDSLYGAWGLHSEWTRQLSRTRLLKLEGEYKALRYRRERYSHYDGPSYSANATLWQQLPRGWTLFGGADWLYRKADEAIYAYQQPGLRLGFSKPFSSGLEATLFASYRERHYDEYSQILGARRRDREQNYTLILRAPELNLAGLTPSLTLKHRRNDSNVDWLYRYERNQISLKLETRF